MQSSTTEPPFDADVEFATKEYRPSVSQWWVGVTCTSICAVAMVGSVALALWNPDGSFSSPVLFAAVFGLSWGGFTLLGAWIVADYYRSRLLLTPEGVVHVGVIWTRGMEFDELQEARWRQFPVGGSLKLRDKNGRTTIEFASYALADRAELVERLRALIPMERQSGWEEFKVRGNGQPGSPLASLVVSVLPLVIFCGFTVLPVVMARRGLMVGPQAVALAAMNVLGAGLCLRIVWRAWGRMRAEGRSATDDRLAFAADASEERR